MLTALATSSSSPSSSSDTTFSIPILVAAAGVGVAWLIVAALIAAMRRPPSIEPGASIGDLPPESPAVAGLLAGDFVVTAETAPAILLDLAARNLVDLEEVQPGKTICRVHRTHHESLTHYEQQVLDAIEVKAIDGVVPADALTTGIEDASKGWHRQLTKKIVTETQARGLTNDRWPKRLVSVLGLTVFVSPGLCYLAGTVGGDSDQQPVVAGVFGGLAVASFVVGVLVVGRLSRSLAQSPTPAGITAAARIRGFEEHLRENESFGDLPPAAVTIWGRHFAYAAACGTAPLAVEGLPMGAEDDHHAWSRYGGRWRRVHVRYPRVVPPTWGRHPLTAVALAIMWATISGIVIYGLATVASAERDASITEAQWDTVVIVCLITMVPFALAIVWSLWVLVRATPDLWRTRTVTGEIVRKRQFRRSGGSRENPQCHYYLAVDDGKHDKVVAWRTREDLWQAHSQGETVRAEITANLGYVRSME